MTPSGARLLERGAGVLEAADVAVDDHRQRRGLLDPADEGPVGLPLYIW